MAADFEQKGKGTIIGISSVAGRDIYMAWKKGKHKIYTGSKMRWIMAAIKSIPESIMLKMRNL